jgi:hypothetical protein
MVLGAGGLGKVGLVRAAEVLLIRSLGSIDCRCAPGGGRLGKDVSTHVGEGIPSSGADVAF